MYICIRAHERMSSCAAMRRQESICPEEAASCQVVFRVHRTLEILRKTLGRTIAGCFLSGLTATALLFTPLPNSSVTSYDKFLCPRPLKLSLVCHCSWRKILGPTPQRPSEPAEVLLSSLTLGGKLCST